MKENWINKPFAHFITFTTYGTWLHGTDKGSVDKLHNHYGLEFLSANAFRQVYEARTLKNAPIVLDISQRKSVLFSIKEICEYRDWELHAVHVRSNHVHVIVSADAMPEKVLADFKAYATRRLRKFFPLFIGIKIWTHYDSTKYIWGQNALASVLQYVIYEQGKPMEWWCRYEIQNPQSPECE